MENGNDHCCGLSVQSKKCKAINSKREELETQLAQLLDGCRIQQGRRQNRGGAQSNPLLVAACVTGCGGQMPVGPIRPLLSTI